MRILTKEEKKYITNNFNIITNNEIANNLKISLKTLSTKINELGLKKIKRVKKFERYCPACKKIIIHTNSNNCYQSEKKKRKCQACNNLERSINMLGEENHFYGKKHTLSSIKSISKNRIGQNNSIQTQFKKGHKSTHNPNFLEIWKQKYDEKTYDLKVKEFKEKQSINNSGANNSMYGKPSPLGSGNGWSGWYRGWFFRSLNELSYMIQVIERFNLKWESGELEKYKIQYIDYNGNNRNYFPDFIINDKYIVECKPKKLWKSINVILKTNAAIEYCDKNNLKYKLVECRKLSFNEIKGLYDNNLINFTDKYEKKFIDNYY